MNGEILSIRGHHLLCLPRFVGRGYSPEFTRNVGNVLSRLRKGPALARLVDGPDAVCQACPHLVKGVCQDVGASSERIRLQQDQHVLVGLGIELGSVIPWSRLEKAFQGTRSIDLDFVCGACRWSEICWGAARGGRHYP